MDCKRADWLMIEAAVGELPLDRRPSVREHLGSCPGCRAAFRRTSQLVWLVDRVLQDGALLNKTGRRHCAAPRSVALSVRI